MQNQKVCAQAKAASKKGIWSGLNPAVALGGACLLTLAIACCATLEAALCSLGVGILLLALARLSCMDVATKLFAVNFFMLFLFLIVPFTSPGPYLWQYGHLKLSKSGLDICILATLKGNAIVMIFLSLVGPMPVGTLGAALRGIGCPDKLTWLFLLMERNLHLLGETWRKLREGASLRAFRPAANLHCYKTYAAMLAIFFIRAYDRGIAMREAMLLAGFDGRIPFACDSRFSWLDALFSVVVLAIAILILAAF